MWIRNIKVIVENISPKNVIEAGITVQLPETGTGRPDSPILTTGTNLGKYPENAFLQRDGTSKKLHDYNPAPIDVPPGGKMTFALSENSDPTQQAAYKISLQITEVEILLDTVYFGDGSIWRSQTFFVPKPPPIVWEKITPEEFFHGSPPASH